MPIAAFLRSDQVQVSRRIASAGRTCVYRGCRTASRSLGFMPLPTVRMSSSSLLRFLYFHMTADHRILQTPPKCPGTLVSDDVSRMQIKPVRDRTRPRKVTPVCAGQAVAASSLSGIEGISAIDEHCGKGSMWHAPYSSRRQKEG
jgi:hypothetical protein